MISIRQSISGTKYDTNKNNFLYKYSMYEIYSYIQTYTYGKHI